MFSMRDTTTAGLLTPCWYLEKPVGVIELLAVGEGEIECVGERVVDTQVVGE